MCDGIAPLDVCCAQLNHNLEGVGDQHPGELQKHDTATSCLVGNNPPLHPSNTADPVGPGNPKLPSCSSLSKWDCPTFREKFKVKFQAGGHLSRKKTLLAAGSLVKTWYRLPEAATSFLTAARAELASR